ncbi:hypothetical protein K5Q02_14030 [Pseudomonas sp. MM211]|uniref:hypothetical protein n=1 Tax=Pseudomonas sp. MM211 TaxID=2866808 RepID=UPI001CEC2EB5|nr:hypothetical protein [Pseudomonas sp. MM211]UCJ14991.1 hypothetical protein K5Q02_14030 [Pseudomonas sp. MM211]
MPEPTIKITMRDLQNSLKELYGEKNKSSSFEYIYAHAAQNCAYLARAVEKGQDPSTYFISSFSWLCALGTHLKIDIQDSFLSKFPNCCAYCLESNCICAKTNKTSLKFTNQKAAREERSEKYNSIKNNPSLTPSAGDIAKNLNSIYPSNLAIWKTHGCHHHFSRLFEELGEVYEAYCSHVGQGRPVQAIEEELADCIAWLLSAWDIQYPKLDFSDGFNNIYAQNCPICHNTQCACSDHYARNKALHSEEDLQRLLASLTELSTQLSKSTPTIPSIEEALTLVNQATEELKESAQTKITSDLRQTVSRNETLLARAKNILIRTPEVADKFNSLFEAYERITNSLRWT